MLLSRLTTISGILARLTTLWLAAAAVAAPTVAATAAAIAAAVATTTGVAATATLRLGFADTRHHFGSGCLGGGLHHVTAWRLANAAPDGLAAHGQRLGFFAGFGFKTGHGDFFDVLLGEALDVLHEAFF
ncbi:MAG: hypothetical protein V4711_05600, partial [Pseudomonadota bacterium]